jgi:hypothetical protein
MTGGTALGLTFLRLRSAARIGLFDRRVALARTKKINYSGRRVRKAPSCPGYRLNLRMITSFTLR